MSDITKISALSTSERSEMPFETLVRAYYHAKAASKKEEFLKAPASVREVTADNLKGYVAEITHRLSVMSNEEDLDMVKQAATWDRYLEKELLKLKQKHLPLKF